MWTIEPCFLSWRSITSHTASCHLPIVPPGSAGVLVEAKQLSTDAGVNSMNPAITDTSGLNLAILSSMAWSNASRS